MDLEEGLIRRAQLGEQLCFDVSRLDFEALIRTFRDFTPSIIETLEWPLLQPVATFSDRARALFTRIPNSEPKQGTGDPFNDRNGLAREIETLAAEALPRSSGPRAIARMRDETPEKDPAGVLALAQDALRRTEETAAHADALLTGLREQPRRLA